MVWPPTERLLVRPPHSDAAGRQHTCSGAKHSARSRLRVIAACMPAAVMLRRHTVTLSPPDTRSTAPRRNYACLCFAKLSKHA